MHVRRDDLLNGLKADPALASLQRSLDVYYGDAQRDAAMDKLYARFVKPGDLAFDVGSHVGDRIGSFRRCGARVVALEPQPDCARVIRSIYGEDAGVTLVEFRLRSRPRSPQAPHQFQQPDCHHGEPRVHQSGGRGWRLGGADVGPRD